MTLRERVAGIFTTAPAVTASLTALPLDVRSPFIPPESHLGGVVMSDVFHELATSDYAPMTRAAAMSIPTVRRARNIMCATLARLPIDCIGPTGTPRTDIPWLRKPDPAVTRASQIAWTFDDLLFYDVSYAVVLGRSLTDGRPLGLRRVEVWRVSPPNPRGTGAERSWRVDDQPVDPSNLIRIDGLGGGGILAGNATSLRIATRLEAAAARIADNPVPAFELHQEDGPELTQGEVDSVLRTWVEGRKKYGVGFTSKGIKGTAHGAPAEHLLTEGRGRQDTDLARIMGVPADMVDAQSGATMTYANAAQRAEALIDYGLANLAYAVEARWSEDDLVPYGSSVRFDLSKLSAASIAAADPEAAPAPSPEPVVPA